MVRRMIAAIDAQTQKERLGGEDMVRRMIRRLTRGRRSG